MLTAETKAATEASTAYCPVCEENVVTTTLSNWAWMNGEDVELFKNDWSIVCFHCGAHVRFDQKGDDVI